MVFIFGSSSFLGTTSYFGLSSLFGVGVFLIFVIVYIFDIKISEQVRDELCHAQVKLEVVDEDEVKVRS